MKSLFGVTVFVCAFLFAGCGKDPRQVRITEKNRDTFIKEIKDMNEPHTVSIIVLKRFLSFQY